MKTSMLLRSAYTGILYYSGILRAMRYPKGMPGVILAYHRVIPAESKELKYIQPGMYVTTETFERQMEYIARHYNVIALDDLIENKDAENACIVTFDDGWYDNYRYALPILKKYSIPAAVFLATSLIGTNRWTWPERIAYYINASSDDKVEAAIDIVRSQIPEMPSPPSDRTALADGLVEFLKKLPEGARRRLMDRIDACMDALRPELEKKRQWLTWDEIREMASLNIAFGAHSHNHVILTQTDIASAAREVEDSRNMLMNELKKPVFSFSYPNGDYNRELMHVLDGLGFKLAVTTEPGMLDESESPLALKRIMIHNDMTKKRHMFVYRITKRVSR